jgi:hypothetical protein
MVHIAMVRLLLKHNASRQMRAMCTVGIRPVFYHLWPSLGSQRGHTGGGEAQAARGSSEMFRCWQVLKKTLLTPRLICSNFLLENMCVSRKKYKQKQF